LVLGRCGNKLLGGKMGEESLNLLALHIFRMPFIVKKDVAANPLHINFLGAVRIMFDTNGITHLVKELFRTVFHSHVI
jgi:acyl-[acyl carrier protein]--UDP-N-acetylglucosamine O-acyltransferase